MLAFVVKVEKLSLKPRLKARLLAELPV